MKGDSLTASGLTDEMSSQFAKCVDVLENMKENSQIVHRLNGFDVSLKDIECNFMPSSLQRTDTMESNCMRVDSYKFKEKHENLVLSTVTENISPLTSEQTSADSDTNDKNKKFSHSVISHKIIQSSVTKENHETIQEQTSLFKVPNSSKSVADSMCLNISPSNIERLREASDSVLKTPLREILKAKFYSRTKCTSNCETHVSENIAKTPLSHQKLSNPSKNSKRVHFVAENFFKVCDKNEIKTLLSPLMKISLSEILRPKVNIISANKSRNLDMKSEINLSKNVCNKNCKKEDSFAESDNSYSLKEIISGTPKDIATNKSFSSDSVCQGDTSNDQEQEKDISSDESLWRLVPSTNYVYKGNIINLSSSNERWKTAMSPLLKTSISDILRSKLSKSDKTSNSCTVEAISHKIVPKKSCHSTTTNMKRHKIILNERITRSKPQCIQTRSKKDKNIGKSISTISNVKSPTFSKSTTAKMKENSSEENTFGNIMPHFAPQTCGITTITGEKASLISIVKRKTRKKYFRGGKYNFVSKFSKKKNRQGKLSKDDESASGIQSERGSFLTDGWPSDVSLHGSFSSFSSEQFASSEDVNHSKFNNNQINIMENENVLQGDSAISHITSTKSHELIKCSRILEIKDFMKVSSNNISNILQHCKSHIGDDSSHFVNKEDFNKTCDSRTVSLENNGLPFDVNMSSGTHSLLLQNEHKKDLINSNNSKKMLQESEYSSNKQEDIYNTNILDQHKEFLSNEYNLIELSQGNCNKENTTNPLNKMEELHCSQDEKILENVQLNIKDKVQCFKNNLDRGPLGISYIKNTTISETCASDLATISYADYTNNFDEDTNKQLGPQNAGDKLREMISEKQDGVYVTITINADGIVEDIERIDPSLFVDITTQSSFIPIEESSEVPVDNSSILECMPTNVKCSSKDSELAMQVEETSIPEPCYTLEITGDDVSTITTEQFHRMEKHCEISSLSQLAKESLSSEKVSWEELKINDSQKENLSIAGNVKGRRRSKRKFPEDHFDVDCLSLGSSSSTENETESDRQKRRGKISSFSIKENTEVILGPPKLKLETCSIFDHTLQGGPCHKTLYTSSVGVYLINELYHSEQNLLMRRIGINLENPRLTICHHHKKVFLDKFDEIQKTGNGNSITKCSCYDSPVEIENSEVITGQLPISCEAKDSIDDKVIGCSNFVTKHQLVRASEKVSRMILCEVHLWRLHHHQCCPNCGIFCTQGTFSQCVTQRKSHYQLHLFHVNCTTSPSNGLNVYCPHCGTESNFRKIKLELNISVSPSNRSKSKAFTRSETKSMLPDEDQTNSINKREESIKPLPSTLTATEKLCITKAQQQALLSALEGVNTNARSTTIKPSFGAIKTGDIDRILHMLASGFNPNHRFEDHRNDTPLHIAAEIGHLAIVQLLIQAGASVDHTNDTLFTPLMLAVVNNHLSVILYLLAAGAHLDARNEDGTTSLHLAAQDGHNEICNILLNSGKIDINIQDDGGWTPLVWAAENQHLETVKLLLKRGADPNIHDNEENISLHWSAFSGNVDISQLFLDVGCELRATNIHGDTPLHISARQGNYECVILFLARGADTKVKNNKSETPIMCCLDQHSQTWMVLNMNDGENTYLEKNSKPQGKLLHRDISRGQEFMPIQCYNGEDNKSVPDDFTYITENCENDYVNIDRTITSLQSCRCNNKCRYPTCSCVTLSFKCWYDEKSHLLPEFNMSDPPMIFECNPGCLCWKDCSSRVVQYGIRCHLQVFRTEEIEWGVRTLQDIPKGTFVCEYVGEYVSELDLEKRSDDSYLFELDSREEVRYCLDAKYFGNVGRFINHLCDANLCPVKVFIEHQDLNFPRIAFFTTRHVKSYEQLGFDYGPRYWTAKYKQGLFCMCNSSKCRYNRDSISSTLNDFAHSSEEEQSKDDT